MGPGTVTDRKSLRKIFKKIQNKEEKKRRKKNHALIKSVNYSHQVIPKITTKSSIYTQTSQNELKNDSTNETNNTIETNYQHKIELKRNGPDESFTSNQSGNFNHYHILQDECSPATPMNFSFSENNLIPDSSEKTYANLNDVIFEKVTTPPGQDGNKKKRKVSVEKGEESTNEKVFKAPTNPSPDAPWLGSNSNPNLDLNSDQNPPSSPEPIAKNDAKNPRKKRTTTNNKKAIPTTGEKAKKTLNITEAEQTIVEVVNMANANANKSTSNRTSIVEIPPILILVS